MVKTQKYSKSAKLMTITEDHESTFELFPMLLKLVSFLSQIFRVPLTTKQLSFPYF